MVKRDYYDLLGIDHLATTEEIKRAYRRLAHQFHPDKNPGNPAAEEHFRRITEAYEILQDAQKRAAYDRYGFFRGSRGFGGFTEPEEFSFRKNHFDGVFEELFADFFQNPRRRQKKSRGADLRYNLEISLEEAAFGAEREIKVTRRSVCLLCQGSRCAPGTTPTTCPACRGYSFLRSQRGFFVVETTCERCQGEGEIIVHPCPKCKGIGHLKISRLLRINIPPGVDYGTRLRLGREGEMGRNGGLPGDLYVIISIKKHALFTRLGNDLRGQISIPFYQALTGGEIEIPTLEGKIRVKLPAKTPAGKILTIKEQGMPILHGSGRGDLHITVGVEIPQNLSKSQREMLDQFRRLSQEGQDSGKQSS